MRRSSRTTASISNAAIRVKVRAMEAENRCAVGMSGRHSDGNSAHKRAGQRMPVVFSIF